MSPRRISASLLCPYVKVFVLFKTARRQEEKKQLDPWIGSPASGSLGSASGLLSPHQAGQLCPGVRARQGIVPR